jgi:hypothetical protein
MNSLISTNLFFPVGQGLFAYGVIGYNNKNYPLFRWVYDCGTVSSNELIKSSIKILESEQRSKLKPTLDLVVISHFDKDHISGLVDLLTRFRVETLMMPFTSLEQRLRTMFSSHVYTSIADQRFFINPIAYLAEIDSIDIGQIVLVPASSSNFVPITDNNPGEPSPDNDESTPRTILNLQDGEPAPGEEIDLELAQISVRKGTSVRLMHQDSAAFIFNDWEFIPYNEPSLLKTLDNLFLVEVNRKREQLLNGISAVKSIAVKDLKKIFDNRFGNSSVNRNVISLFLYAGPSKKRALYALFSNTALHSIPSCNWYCEVCFCHPCSLDCITKSKSQSGIFFTGDGFIDTPARLASLKNFYGSLRLQKLVAIQVMHHGSNKNWFKGLAAQIQPGISIFSSDPKRGLHKSKVNKQIKPHPHKEVLDDFEPFHPMQADKHKSVKIFTFYK